MRSHLFPLAWLALCGLLLPTAASAGSYVVELLVFQRNGADASAAERWSRKPGTPEWGNAAALEPDRQPPPMSLVTDAGQLARSARGGATLLSRDAWRLGPEHYTLDRAQGRYETVFHQAWSQPVGSRRSTNPIYIEGPERRGGVPRLQGTVDVTAGRFLHLDIDLLLNGVVAADPATNPGGGVRLVANRKMRSGELHYIDSPLIGVLVRIGR